MFKRAKVALLTLTPASILLGLAGPAHGVEGGFLTSESSYYDDVLGSESLEAFESSQPGLPTALAVDIAEEVLVEYRSTSDEDVLKWELAVDGFRRPHASVVAVYQVVLIVPLPAGDEGQPLWRPLTRAMRPRVSLDPDAPPVLYRGSPVRFRRNVALEKTWLPELVGTDEGQLPALSGTGYQWTLWDTLLLHDPEHGDEVAGSLQFYYETPKSVAGPDASDQRLGVYLVSWIPKLTHEIAPLAIRASLSPPES